MNFYFFLIVCATIGFAFTLECGGSNRQNLSEVKRIASACLKRTKPKEAAHSEEQPSEESSDEGGFDITEDAYGYRRRHKRSDGENDKNQSNENDDDQEDAPNYQDTEIPDTCVVKCIFERLDLLNSKGYPDHNKVSQAFLRNDQGRELRDFLQDSTHDCFELMEQASFKENSCNSVIIKGIEDYIQQRIKTWPNGSLLRFIQYMFILKR